MIKNNATTLAALYGSTTRGAIGFAGLSEALRTVVFMDDDSYFGEMKQSWKDHWKARYMKHWRKYLDSQDSSVPYFKEKDKNVKNID